MGLSYVVVRCLNGLLVLLRPLKARFFQGPVEYCLRVYAPPITIPLTCLWVAYIVWRGSLTEELSKSVVSPCSFGMLQGSYLIYQRSEVARPSYAGLQSFLNIPLFFS